MTLRCELKEKWKTGLEIALTRPDEALRLLDEAIDLAGAMGDASTGAFIAEQAGAICSSIGNHRRALGYYESALVGHPEHAGVHWFVGDARRTLGLVDEARLAFAQCRDLATAQGDLDIAEVAAEALAGLATK